MLNHNNFKYNLSKAQQTEKLVGEILCKNIKGLSIINDNNDNKKYDILAYHASGKYITFEIKEDIRCANTGNVVVEFESFGKPSGIATTLADWWVFCIHLIDRVEYMAILTNELKRLIEQKKYSKIFQMKTTDSSNKVYFFRYDYLKTECSILKGL